MNAAERTEAPDASTLAVMTGPTSEAVLHPLVMVDDQKVLPRDYIVHHRSQRCLNCGTTHEWSDTYARNEVPANFNIGTVQNLVPVQRFRFNLPVRHVRSEARPVPVCHECIGNVDLSHLPDPRDSEEWKAIVKRKLAQENAAIAKGKAPKKPKVAPTIDDILGAL